MEMNHYNKEETMSREELKKLQSERLIKTVKNVYDNVPAYRKKMDENGIKPEDIKSIDDLKLLPFTYKQDLRDNYPYGMFACPAEGLVRVHASSGTTGKSTVVGYTENDISVWSDICARALVRAGGNKSDFVHVSYGYGLFTGGLGMHYGTERLGATAIPVSVGNTQRQIQIMQDFGSTILCSTPSYALYLAETLEQMGAIDKIKLKAGIFGAEPWTENMRKEIEKRLNIKAYDIYGLSEIMGPGVSSECSAQAGMHIAEDHFIAEIIDPDTGELAAEGEWGEIVFTCITKEALPLIRYRTRDISCLDYEKCECGCTMVRMKKPSGRSDDMLIIRGVNVFPSQIESVLCMHESITPNYLIVVDRVDNLDIMEIQVEMADSFFDDEVKKIEKYERKIKAAIESTLGIAAQVRLVDPRSIPRSEGKAKRVLDKRVLF